MGVFDNRNDLNYCKKCSGSEMYVREIDSTVEIRCKHCKHVVTVFKKGLIKWGREDKKL